MRFPFLPPLIDRAQDRAYPDGPHLRVEKRGELGASLQIPADRQVSFRFKGLCFTSIILVSPPVPEIDLSPGGPCYQESYNKDAIKCSTEHKLNAPSTIHITSTCMTKTRENNAGVVFLGEATWARGSWPWGVR